MTDGSAVDDVFASIGPFDHLVTSAAGALSGKFAQLAEDDVRAFFEVKFWRQYRAVKAALPGLAEDGSAVLLSGFLYRKTDPGFSPFAAVNGATEAAPIASYIMPPWIALAAPRSGSHGHERPTHGSGR